MPRIALLTLVVVLLTLAPAVPLAAQTGALRDLDGHCPFTPPPSLEAWQARAAEVKLQMQVALGLLPALELDPVEADIYGKVQRDDYTIEKVTFESLPGFFVTGNLYRPNKIPASGKIPGILCPHGHWTNARFYEASPKEVQELLASGAERFENAAKHHIQARCVQLARMGCTVFHWDMIGYCDSVQISLERAHRFANQDPSTEVDENGWLLFSPLAESHCQSILGLQSLATQRAVDMLLSLPEVDPERIAITGASGGGTQSFIGAALDERIRVAFPAVMVSTGMQGGCTCENASLLRTGTGNVEMAGLIAPRPLGLTAANDWTRTMPEDGYPQLKQLYRLYDAAENVALFPAIHFGHNFNHVSRVAMYGWMNDHLHLGFEKPILERDFVPALRDELHVWSDGRPVPPSGQDFERQLLKLWAEIVDSQMQGWLRGDEQQLAKLHAMLQDGWRVNLGLTTGAVAPAQGQRDESTAMITLSLPSLPAWELQIGAEGRAEADEQAENGEQTDRSSEQEQAHAAVMQAWQPSIQDLRIELQADGEQSPTVFYPVVAGEDLQAGQRTRLQAIVKNPRLSAAYTFGYNMPLFAQRAQQIGLSLRWLAEQYPNRKITVHATAADAALAAAGAFVAEQLGSQDAHMDLHLELQPQGFSFAAVQSIRDPNFLPGSARFWDLPGLLRCLRAEVSVEE